METASFYPEIIDDGDISHFHPSPQRLVSSDRSEHPKFQIFEQYLHTINVHKSTSSRGKENQNQNRNLQNPIE